MKKKQQKNRVHCEIVSIQIDLTDRAIDPRKIMFIRFEFNSYQTFEFVLLTLNFRLGGQAKLFELYMFSCCEDLRGHVTVVSTDVLLLTKTPSNVHA